MKKSNSFFINLQRVSATAKIFLLQNLSIMVKTGVPLAESIKTLAEQTKNKKLKMILRDLYEKIKQGKTLSEGLSPYEKDFGELFINMIKAGEASGNLEGVLNKLYQEIKKDHSLTLKVRNALTYPVIIIIAMIGISAFMLIFVLPNITNLFKDFDIELPLTTRIMIGVSDFIQQNGLLVATVLIILFAVLFKTIRTKKGKRALDAIILKLPIISPIIKKINLARISRSLSSLIKTDIAIAESMTITAHIVGNSLYREAMLQAVDQVKKGVKIETVFRNYPRIFPPVIIQMIAVGEETGALDEVLDNLADFYEEEVFQTMDSLPSIIEPILMILIGVAVAVIALAIMMPIYSLTEAF
ncbi:MAG: type II secretion system F family protein [Patescibacteria group bacterium]